MDQVKQAETPVETTPLSMLTADGHDLATSPNREWWLSREGEVKGPCDLRVIGVCGSNDEPTAVFRVWNSRRRIEAREANASRADAARLVWSTEAAALRAAIRWTTEQHARNVEALTNRLAHAQPATIEKAGGVA